MNFLPSRAVALRVLAALTFLLTTNLIHAASPQSVSPGYMFERGGLTYVHLEGTPAQIGFQHGSLLAAKIDDLVNVYKIENLHRTKREWAFYRDAAKKVLWPQVEKEYREEMEGIAKGVESKGYKLDLWDIVALNGEIELSQYYVPWLDKSMHAEIAPDNKPEGRCSAFVATGSYTKDHKIVIAHSNWSSYAEGERWTMIFDIVPTSGNHILMDGEPGVITSDDDFGINSAGIMITETTITDFEGWDSGGIPEFVRSRKAMQYANSIDEYAAIMRKGNNGGYANDWLVGDRKTGEIAYLELGLKSTPMWRTKDGYFVSSNFARDPKLIKEETPGFDYNDLSTSENARRISGERMIKDHKGAIDPEFAEAFLSAHYDSYTHQEIADQRSLCGHVDTVKAGIPEWGWESFYPSGAVTGQLADSDMAEHMSLIARAGHPCGEDFHAAPFLAMHPEFGYLKPILKDMIAGPWTHFTKSDTKKN